MDIVDRIALLILRNPTITARELAEKLDYAQEKSVYYWLNKAGYKGVTDFKKAVLSGNYPVPEAESPAFETREARDDDYRLQRIPLRSVLKDNEHTAPAQDERETLYVSASGTISDRAFAVVIQTDEYCPLVQPNDIIIVDPQAEFDSGDLLFVRRQDNGHCLRRVYGNNSFLFIHPTEPKYFQRVKEKTGRMAIIGKITRIIRPL